VTTQQKTLSCTV